MFSNVERTRLLPTAIPTVFGSYIETTAQDSANQTIADDSLTDEIIVTSTPLKQDQSVSVASK